MSYCVVHDFKSLLNSNFMYLNIREHVLFSYHNAGTEGFSRGCFQQVI